MRAWELNESDEVKKKINTPEFKELLTPGLVKLDNLYKTNGHDLRIVGGAVRDLMLKKTPKDIDLALIPGIAFDKDGHRVGHGKAYYDKLNKELKCKKISLAYNFQVLENIPVEKHDEKIDMIITEKNTLNFKL